MNATRRDLLRTTAAGTAGLLLSGSLAPAAPAIGLPGAPAELPPLPLDPLPTDRKGDMLYRKLGQTNETVSLIGLGGAHLLHFKDEAEATQVIHAAIDRGITFMDNCWDYGEGKAETLMGKALKDGNRREKIFLMTKIDGRTAPAAAKQIDESLKRLQTDHIDLMQHHEILRMEDPDRIFAEGGAMEAVVAAQKAGKIRYIGFTGHKDPLVHLRMLEVADQHQFHFDAAQMPLNLMDAHFRSFARYAVPALVQRGVGILGMKSMGSGDILKSKTVQPIDCLHYAMSLPTSVVITGIDSAKILDQAVEAARTFKPLTQDQVAALMEKTKLAAASGKFEQFKTGTKYDGTAHNPKWLG